MPISDEIERHLAMRGVNVCQFQEILRAAAASEKVTDRKLKEPVGLLAYLQSFSSGNLSQTVSHVHQHLVEAQEIASPQCPTSIVIKGKTPSL